MAGREKDIDEILNEDKADKPEPVVPEPDDLAMADAPADAVPPQPLKPVNWRLWLGLLLIVAAGIAGWQAPKWLGLAPGTAAIEARLAAADTANAEMKSELAALKADLAALAARPVGVTPEDLNAVAGTSDALKSEIAALKETEAALANRMTALERAASAAPTGTPPDAALAGLQSQIDQLATDLKGRTDALETRLAALETRPEPEPAAPAPSAGALAEITAAIEQGQSFAAPLLALREVHPGAPEIEVLAAHANGVLTLDALKSGFPEAARAALSAARASEVTEGETSGRFGAFLKDQLGMRSLAPQDGADADAVLSRVEAKLTGGDLGGALTELAALPEAAKPAMADWIAAATARRDVTEALAALTAGSN